MDYIARLSLLHHQEFSGELIKVTVEKVHSDDHVDTKNPKISKHIACNSLYFQLFYFQLIVSRKFSESPTNGNHAARS